MFRFSIYCILFFVCFLVVWVLFDHGALKLVPDASSATFLFFIYSYFFVFCHYNVNCMHVICYQATCMMITLVRSAHCDGNAIYIIKHTMSTVYFMMHSIWNKNPAAWICLMYREQYKLKRCPNKECCKQCIYGMFKGTMPKWPVQKLTQVTTHTLLQTHDATGI